MLCAPEQDLRGGVTTQQERLAKEARAVEISDHGGDSACWAHLLCPECGAISSEGHHRGCESEQVRVSNGSVAMDQALTASMSTDRMVTSATQRPGYVCTRF
jgi:hypothetical protein